MKSFEVISSMISMAFILALVMGLAYITTRYVGMSSVKRFKNSNIKLIEVMSIGYQKYLYIVKVTDKFMVLSVTKDDVKLLDTVDTEKVIINQDEGLIGKDFKNMLEKVIKRQSK
ncbi:MAG TPA: flagellar biosynthetic protein FliO [Clostridiales bacterium]|nr:MAG: flagellar biosynthetic protein FliO [Clostridiales bacterium GWD2_32_59]HAN10597.1 flagellar biosynthetic protein FliO [Clostridiales bacterium]